LSNKRFHADSFTPTQWNTAEEKAKFANQLLAFIAEDFPERKFTNAFYERLSGCFSMVAHYVEGVIMWSVFANTA
jgi:hypothetical protein